MEIDLDNIGKLKKREAYDVRGLSFEDKMQVVEKLKELGHYQPNVTPDWEKWHNKNKFDVIWNNSSVNIHPREIEDSMIKKVLALPIKDEIQKGDVVVFDDGETYNRIARVEKITSKGYHFDCNDDYYFNVKDCRKATLEDFKNTKIKVDTPKKSEAFQKLIFSLGGLWNGISNKNKVKHIDSQYLFCDKFLTYDYFEQFFNEHKYKEILFDDLFPDWNENKIDTSNATITWKDIKDAKQMVESSNPTINNSGKVFWKGEEIGQIKFTGTEVSYSDDIYNILRKNKEENKMELKNMNKENIQNGIEKVKKDRATAEALEAERQYKTYLNEKDSIARQRKQLDEREKEMKERYKELIAEEKKVK